MKAKEREVYEMHAEVCKVLSSPLRLHILNLLQGSELTVGEIVTATGSLKSNVSQHLAVLKRSGVLTSRKQGQNVFYKISDTRIIKACLLMREVLMTQLEKKAQLLTLKGEA